jgi:hypothetical protein
VEPPGSVVVCTADDPGLGRHAGPAGGADGRSTPARAASEGLTLLVVVGLVRAGGGVDVTTPRTGAVGLADEGAVEGWVQPARDTAAPIDSRSAAARRRGVARRGGTG